MTFPLRHSLADGRTPLYLEADHYNTAPIDAPSAAETPIVDHWISWMYEELRRLEAKIAPSVSD